MAALRHIAVHVEEPRPGRFAWVLSERDQGQWQVLQRCASPEASYRQAMADGLLALQALVPDLEQGPRCTGEGKEPGHARRQHDASPKRTAPAGKAYFGFGPAR